MTRAIEQIDALRPRVVWLAQKIYTHRVARNASALAIVQVVSYLAPLAAALYLTRKLGVDTYGLVAFSASLVQLAVMVLDFGFSLSATQKVSVWREKKQYVARLLGAALTITLIGFFVAATAISLYALLNEKYKAHTALFLLSLVPLLGQCFQPIWFFSGIERMRFITIFLVSSKLLYVLFLFMFVRDGSDYLWVPVANGIAQISGAVIAFQLIYRAGYYIAVPRWKDLKYTVRMTSGFFASVVSTIAFRNTGVVLLGLVSSPAAVAVYALADQIYRAAQSIFGPLVQAIYPYMAKERNLKLLLQVSLGAIAVSALGAAFGYLVLPILVPMFLGPQWKSLIPVMNVFLLAMIVNLTAVLSGYPLAAILGLLQSANRSVIYGSFVYVLLAGMMLSRGHATTVSFAVLVLIAESYVLFHRAVEFWPKAYHTLVSPRSI